MTKDRLRLHAREASVAFGYFSRGSRRHTRLPWPAVAPACANGIIRRRRGLQLDSPGEGRTLN